MDTVLLILVLALVVYEIVAIVNKRRGDTISENSWDVRDHSLGARILADVLLIWGFWHLWVDDQFFVQGISWVDSIVVAAATVEAWWSWGWSRNRP